MCARSKPTHLNAQSAPFSARGNGALGRGRVRGCRFPPVRGEAAPAAECCGGASTAVSGAARVPARVKRADYSGWDTSGFRHSARSGEEEGASAGKAQGASARGQSLPPGNYPADSESSGGFRFICQMRALHQRRVFPALCPPALPPSGKHFRCIKMRMRSGIRDRMRCKSRCTIPSLPAL